MIPASSSREGTSAQDPAEAPPPREKTLLLVDDSPVDRHFIADLIGKQLGWAVTTVGTGEEAVAALRARTPSMVLTDLVMPGMSGLELLEEVRREFPRVPVVLVTAYGNEELAIKALRGGAANYVPKRKLARDLIRALTEVEDAICGEHHRERLLDDCLQGVERRFELANDPALVPPLVQHLQQYFLPLHLGDENTRIRVGIALEEALLNGLYHGNLEVHSDLRETGGMAYYELAERRRHEPPYNGRRLHMEAYLSRGSARFVVRDEGPGFDTACLPDPTDPANLERASGRGLLLIRTFMDQVVYNERGNQITMIKRGTLPLSA
jgi:CheY-like chemotaxis protein